MVWPYHFPSQTPELTAQRRQSLDFHARLAQLSIFLPLLLIILSKALHFSLTKIAALHNGADREKGQPKSKLFLVTRVLAVWRRMAWWADDDVGSWGTRRELLWATGWATWLGVLVVRGTGDDYLHLTKRFGIVAASQLPLHYLLSAKSPYNPLQLLTSLSHEELNAYHRLLGRILITFFTLHATFYLNFYVQAGFLSKRIRDTDVQLGLAAITGFLIIATSTLAPIRRYSYRLFYIIHIISAPTLLIILFFHVTHIRVYVLETFAIFILFSLQRYFLSQRHATAVLNSIPDTSLVSITIRPPPSAKLSSYGPGQHVYLSPPNTSLSSPSRFAIMNPFSIANLPSEDRNIQLVVRALGGPTKSLAQTAAITSSEFSVPFTLEDPYGASRFFPDLIRYDAVLLVAGGVGGTFTVPIYRALLNRLSHSSSNLGSANLSQVDDPDPASYDKSFSDHEDIELHSLTPENPLLPSSPSSPSTQPKIHFHWSVRSPADASWALPFLSTDSSLSSFNLHVTSSSSSIPHAVTPTLPPSIPPSNVTFDRMDLRTIVNGVFGADGVQKVAVLVCGPEQLGRGLRTQVGKWVVGEGKEVFWHAERFGW